MRAVSLTNRGGRKNNEDHIAYANADGIWCFVLCDGLGGQECGEVASEIVCNVICDEFKKKPQLSDTAIREYALKAAEKLGREREADIEKYNMSSTVVVLLTDGKKAIWLHMGDSRLYYFNQRELSLVTDDHSIAFMEFKRGEISYEDIRTSPNQNMLTRCVNDLENFNPQLSDEVEVKKGDAFLMCSDGFWEYVDEYAMEHTLKKSSSPKVWIEKMLKELHKNETPKNDNYSAIAIMV
ncbi:MAG: serine/threonine-protein phosphatase [Clostridia bacterium]|nr:serine/threonine-protein phosphatase [Clostridia bacterium]